MIYKHMFCGYSDEAAVELLKNDEIITSSCAAYNGMVFVYFESKNGELGINDVAKASLKPFPNGEYWYEMPEIFHFFAPETDEQWARKIENKKSKFRINFLYMDKVGSYIYHHQKMQNDNQYNCDKYFAIFIYGNLIIIYDESPMEIVTWQDLEGKSHAPTRSDWTPLMNQHFMPWADGHKGWVDMENAAK